MRGRLSLIWSFLALGALTGCNIFNPIVTEPEGGEDSNHRPLVQLQIGPERDADIRIAITPFDEDGEQTSVTLFYSTDDGWTFVPCTASSSSTNPLEGLLNNDYQTFYWNSVKDVSEGTVIIRAIANDGLQDGPPTDSDPIDVDNSSNITPLPGSPTGNDLNSVGGSMILSFDSNGDAQVELNDGSNSSRTNVEEEFMLILWNTEDTEAYYSLAERPVTSNKMSAVGYTQESWSSPMLMPLEKGEYRQRLEAWRHATYQHPELRTQAVEASKSSSPQTYEVGVTRRSFTVRSDVKENPTYEDRTGILAKVGQRALFFVDEDVPIDWDYDCDGVMDDYDAQGRKTYGFDSCDLAAVSDVLDQNIMVHLNELFGELSDVDENGYATVFITPILNLMTLETSEGTDDGGLDEEATATPEPEEGTTGGQVKVYVDPEVDLMPSDSSNNPSSNYQEIIFLYAPDPAGIFNPSTGGGGKAAIDEYLSVEMGAQLAIAMQRLISYNYHVLQNDGDAEEDWLDDGLSLLAADLTGFGSLVYNDVLYYLDAPYYYSLTEENSINSIDDRGLQYLFCRFLFDTQEPDILGKLIGSSSTGIDSIEAIFQEENEEFEFAELYAQFLMAISLGGMTNSSTGKALYSGDNFKTATTIPVASADYQGAGGYQQGINLFGANYARSKQSDGTYKVATYTLHGADYSHFAPGVDYSGYLATNYGAQFTWVGGLIDAQTTIDVDANDDYVSGIVVRLNDIDPETPTMVVEKVFGTLADDLIAMSMFPDGRESVAMGEIDTTQELQLFNGSMLPVDDTDLYLVDLSDSALFLDSVYILARLNRSITTSEGLSSLKQGVLAVVPYGDLPSPSSNEGSFKCDGVSTTVSYPSSYLEYLYYQFVLIPSASQSTTYDPSGQASESPETCNFDQEAEEESGALLQNDADEPVPKTMAEQILTYQVQHLGQSSTVDGFYPYSTSFIDRESTDSDSEPLYDFELGLGGYQVKDGEEGFMLIELPAGSPENKYVFIVGGIEGIGPYELVLKVYTPPV